MLDVSDLDRLAWVELTAATAGTPPKARAYHSMTCADGLLYVFGGWAGFTGEGAPALSLNSILCLWKLYRSHGLGGLVTV